MLLTLGYVNLQAQPDSTSGKSSGFVSLSAGSMFNEDGFPNSSVTLMSGVRFDRFTLAVGAGYDLYTDWKTLPIFVGAGWDLVSLQSGAVYLHVNGGYSKAWERTHGEASVVKVGSGGYFVHPMAGYRLRAGKLEICAAVGYKFQRIAYEGYSWGWVPTRKFIVHDRERLTVELGIGFSL